MGLKWPHERTDQGNGPERALGTSHQTCRLCRQHQARQRHAQVHIGATAEIAIARDQQGLGCIEKGKVARELRVAPGPIFALDAECAIQGAC